VGFGHASPVPPRRQRARPDFRPLINDSYVSTQEDTMGMLDGKVAIVTGAGRGIGREEALLLASEGAKVIVNDVGASLQGEGGDKHPAEEVVDLIKAGGSDAAVNASDVSSWEGAKALVDQAVDTFGQLDILVNNAGILRDKMSFNMEESDWDDVIRVHLKGHFAPAHHAAVYWRGRAKAGEDVSGRIINTSSEAGLFGNAGQANYSAAKAGIASMTWVLARELGRYGITSNSISPRARTRMTENIFGEMAKADDGFDKFDPRNVAQLVTFLATDEAADISGQNFIVYGGDIWAMGGFHPVGELHRNAAWTPQELIDAKGELFKDASSAIPKFSFF
jgi:NAD(P)-dependent dehydrogenase (short-subunit alcohol dehydrogenase family)